MPLTNAGRNFLAAALINSGPPTFFDNSNARLGVGDSDTAFDASQTDLQATTNKLRKGMAASYPQLSANTVTFRSVFETGDANFDWKEIGLFNAANGGTMACRVVGDWGTKTNSQSWQLDLEVEIVIGELPE